MSKNLILQQATAYAGLSMRETLCHCTARTAFKPALIPRVRREAIYECSLTLEYFNKDKNSDAVYVFPIERLVTPCLLFNINNI